MKHALLIPILFTILPLVAADCLAADEPAEIIPVDEIKRGQKGWGLSVFSGSEPERFELEVIGIQRNRKPELSAILAKLSGKGLERSGVFGGMSGSPVYIDGRLAGAVAYSFLFDMDAIAGITPIEAMRKLHGAPGGVQTSGEKLAAARDARIEPVVRWEDLVKREFAPDLFETHLRRALPALSADTRPALHWAAGGFGEKSRALFASALGPLSPGGMTSTVQMASTGAAGGLATDATDLLAPGSSVAAVLIQGDLHAAGYGTVTDRSGDDVLAFGHPMFGLGPVRMPMAPSEVITVISSRANSFKLANVGPVVGAFDQDREAGVRGKIGLEAEMIPVTVRLAGLAEQEYHMEVIDQPQLMPNMVALSAYGSLEAGSFPSGPQGLDLEARFSIAGHDDLVVRQSFDTNQAGVESILYLMSFSSFLNLNDLEEVEIESVEVDYKQVDRPRTATLVGAHVDRRVVRPGETVQLILELQAYRGPRYRETVETTVPRNVPDGRFVIFVGDGTTMDGVRLTIEQRAPQTFEQALEYMQSFSPRKKLRIFGLLSQPGLSVAGEVLPRLPGSVRKVFAGGGPTGTPLALAIALEQEEVFDRPIVGFQRVDLEVRRR